mgnify:CR=1 FL=1
MRESGTRCPECGTRVRDADQQLYDLQCRLEDAGALHLADETTIRQLQRVLEAAKALDRETVAKKMHASWVRALLAQGFHGPAEGCRGGTHQATCGLRHHPNIVLWELLPEHRREISRQAFDNVFGPLWKAIAALEGNDV